MSRHSIGVYIRQGDYQCSKLYTLKSSEILQKQDKTTQKRIVSAISQLPLTGDIKKLQGTEGYRLRVGNYRILFDVNGIIVDIIGIGCIGFFS